MRDEESIQHLEAEIQIDADRPVDNLTRPASEKRWFVIAGGGSALAVTAAVLIATMGGGAGPAESAEAADLEDAHAPRDESPATLAADPESQPPSEVIDPSALVAIAPAAAAAELPTTRTPPVPETGAKQDRAQPESRPQPGVRKNRRGTPTKARVGKDDETKSTTTSLAGLPSPDSLPGPEADSPFVDDGTSPASKPVPEDAEPGAEAVTTVGDGPELEPGEASEEPPGDSPTSEGHEAPAQKPEADADPPGAGEPDAAPASQGEQVELDAAKVESPTAAADPT
jgi:hypothetical protein